MIGMHSDRLKRAGAGHVIKPDGAERSELSIGSDCHDVQIAAVERAALDVVIPLPAFVTLIRRVGIVYE